MKKKIHIGGTEISTSDVADHVSILQMLKNLVMRESGKRHAGATAPEFARPCAVVCQIRGVPGL